MIIYKLKILDFSVSKKKKILDFNFGFQTFLVFDFGIDGRR